MLMFGATHEELLCISRGANVCIGSSHDRWRGLYVGLQWTHKKRNKKDAVWKRARKSSGCIRNIDLVGGDRL